MTKEVQTIKIEKIMNKLKGFNPTVALVLGSGYEDIIQLENKVEIPYYDLGLVYQHISGFSRKFIFGEYKGIKTVIISRFHYYETGDTDNIFMLYNIIKRLGVKTIIATTAVGALNLKYDAGDIVMIKDHINLTGTNPLIGKAPIKFIDMGNCYDKDLRDEITQIGKKLKISLKEGVHLQVSGPTYETVSEVKFFGNACGADTVSMSTVFDCICARFFEMKFVAFAGVSNKALFEGSEPISHEDIVKTSKKISDNVGKILQEFIPTLK